MRNIDIEPTRQLFVGVLRATYVPDTMKDLKLERRSLIHMSSPEGKRSTELFANSRFRGATRDGALKILADYEGYLEGEKGKLQRKVSRYVTGRRSFTRFMAEHGDVVDYIAVLAEGKTETIETPQEEIVFDTLQRLSNNIIMGELGAGSEEMETGLDLAMLIENAAQRHAVRIGQDPDQYLSKISDQKYKMISLHP